MLRIGQQKRTTDGDARAEEIGFRELRTCVPNGVCSRARVANEPKCQFHAMPKNGGKTSAIRKALELATGEIIIIQDADLEYDPAEIPDVIAPILNGFADVAFGSRFLVRKAARVLYFRHYLANMLLTFLSNLLTNRTRG